MTVNSEMNAKRRSSYGCHTGNSEACAWTVPLNPRPETLCVAGSEAWTAPLSHHPDTLCMAGSEAAFSFIPFCMSNLQDALIAFSSVAT